MRATSLPARVAERGSIAAAVATAATVAATATATATATTETTASTAAAVADHLGETRVDLLLSLTKNVDEVTGLLGVWK